MSTESQYPPAFDPPPPHEGGSRDGRMSIPLVVAVGTAAVLVVGAILFWLAAGRVNKAEMAEKPKGVTAIVARAGKYQPVHRYIGAIAPWVEAKVGPQFISAYVDDVAVRPGAVVRRGYVLAILDCRFASAAEKAIAAQARATESTQKAIEDEARRITSLLDGGFASLDESERKVAQSSSLQAQLQGLQAQLASMSLQVGDCILRSPFEGEVGERWKDPGAFVKPGDAIVSVVDRSTVRITVDVPEDDFAAVAPGTNVRFRVLATGEELTRPISRRSPAADPSTRTVHFEVDVPDPQKKLPVYTTAELYVSVGEPVPATEVPLAAAGVRGETATVFVIEKDVAHALTLPVKGERGGTIYVDPSLKEGTLVVLEGRMLLKDGDRVSVKVDENAFRAEDRGDAAPVAGRSAPDGSPIDPPKASGRGQP